MRPVHAIECVNKRDVHVAQSAIAQTETINHKRMVSRIALFLLPQVFSLGWNYTAFYLQHCIFLGFIITLHPKPRQHICAPPCLFKLTRGEIS